LNSKYKESVEGVFKSWVNVTAKFTTNAIKGNYALLELQLLSISALNTVGIEYGGSMESGVEKKRVTKSV